MITEITPPVIGEIYEDTEFSQVLTPTLVDLDDGSYTYQWELNAGVTTLEISDSTAANPILSANNPVAGAAYLNLTVTDFSGNSVVMDEQEVDVYMKQIGS